MQLTHSKVVIHLWYLVFRIFLWTNTIRYSEIFHDWRYSVCGIRKFLRTKIFGLRSSVFGKFSWMKIFGLRYSENFHKQRPSVFGIRKIFIKEDLWSSVFGQFHSSVQLWYLNTRRIEYFWVFMSELVFFWNFLHLLLSLVILSHYLIVWVVQNICKRQAQFFWRKTFVS